MVEARIRPKRKAKPDLRNWFGELFEPVPIDFIAYLSLEECATRLESCKNYGWWGLTNICVTITPVDDAVYDFYIKRERKKHGTVEAHGYLQDCEGNGTVVTGEVVTPFSLPLLRAIIIFGGIWLLLASHPIGVLVFLAVMGMIGTIVDVLTRMRLRHELAEMIETTLGY